MILDIGELKIEDGAQWIQTAVVVAPMLKLFPEMRFDSFFALMTIRKIKSKVDPKYGRCHLMNRDEFDGLYLALRFPNHTIARDCRNLGDTQVRYASFS